MPSESKAIHRRYLSSAKLLDPRGWRILAELQRDARQSTPELARRVGLSPPAVAERVRRLEQAGIIEGYRAVVRPERVGLPLTAFLRLTCAPDRYPRVLATLQRNRQVLDVHHVAGEECFLVKVVAAGPSDLSRLIAELSTFGRTATTLVLDSPLTRYTVEKPAAR